MQRLTYFFETKRLSFKEVDSVWWRNHIPEATEL